MLDAQRDVSGLILGKDQFLIVADNFGGTGYNDPVFGAVVVHLQRQALAGQYADALDLITLAEVYRVVVAPRAIDQWMSDELRALFCLQTLDHVLDLLAVVLVGNQNGVLGFDDDQVLDADGGHQSMVRLHQAVARVDGHHVAFQAIDILVVRAHVPDRCPTAQIVPACVQRYDQTEIGVLHDRVVH